MTSIFNLLTSQKAKDNKLPTIITTFFLKLVKHCSYNKSLFNILKTQLCARRGIPINQKPMKKVKADFREKQDIQSVSCRVEPNPNLEQIGNSKDKVHTHLFWRLMKRMCRKLGASHETDSLREKLEQGRVSKSDR